jgi:AAA15 family ATPase/GTPase
MVAADYGNKQLDHTIFIENYGVSVLKSSVIYGANAAGKSNLLKAIVDGIQLVLNSSKNNKGDPLPHFYNKNQQINKSKLSLYVFGLLINNIFMIGLKTKSAYPHNIIELIMNLHSA